MKILPVFIPQGGCKNRCSFCNQIEITGLAKQQTFEELDELASRYISTAGRFEIAFYGGTFTALPRLEQLKYLRWAHRYVEAGICTGIRISTRPDEIDQERIEFLKCHGVNFVELGVQSFDDEVLATAKRGYTNGDVIRSCSVLKRNQIRFGIHLMVGLPKDDSSKDLLSAMKTVEIGASTCRIHPTLILKGTLLEKWYRQGIYEPISLEDAVEVSSDMLAILLSSGVEVIRIGLFVPENQKNQIVAGPYHPRLGEIVKINLLKKLAAFLSCETFVSEGRNLTINEIRSAGYLKKDFSFVIGDRVISFSEALQKYVGGVLMCSKTS